MGMAVQASVTAGRAGRQRGLSLIGLLFWAILISGAALLAMKVLPSLNEYFTIQRAVNKLAKKTGSDFDKAYVERMVDAHEDAIDLFQKASRDVKDPELQAFASKMLPKLQQHQQHARSLEQTVSGSSGSSRRSMNSGSSSSGSSDSSSTTGAGATP